jgi:hypothetical protein
MPTPEGAIFCTQKTFDKFEIVLDSPPHFLYNRRMTNYKAAHAFASFALAGKVDKAGDPLLAHAERMAAKTLYEDFAILAILHDVLEDSLAEPEYRQHGNRLASPGATWGLTLEGLSLALPRKVFLGLEAITRRENPIRETYAEYIERVIQNPHARVIKMLDLEDHLAHPETLPDSLESRYTKALSRIKAGGFNQKSIFCPCPECGAGPTICHAIWCSEG